MSKTIYALAAIAVAGIHFDEGDVIKGKGISEEEKAKLVRQRKATEEKPEELLKARKLREQAAADADAEEAAARDQEIEDTIRPIVEKIVGEILDARGASEKQA